MDEQLTDGMTGKESAKKFIEGDLPHPMHGYSGKVGDGSSSLINAPKKVYPEYEEKKEKEKYTIKEDFPFMGEEESKDVRLKR